MIDVSMEWKVTKDVCMGDRRDGNKVSTVPRIFPRRAVHIIIIHGPLFSLTVSSFIFPRYCAAPRISHNLLILGGPVKGGTGTVPHCAVLSSFLATMGKISRAAAGGASFRAVPQPFK